MAVDLLNQDLDQVMCRICFEGGRMFLIKPCKCKGTSAYVHYDCLSRWVRVSKQKTCDICKSEYKGFIANFMLFVNYLQNLNEDVDCKVQEFFTGIYLIITVFICLFYAWYVQWTSIDDQSTGNEEVTTTKRRKKFFFLH